MRRNKTTLDPEESSGNIRLVSDDSSPAVGIFLNLSVSNSGNRQNIVLFAKNHTKLPLTTVEKLAIFSVSPDLSAKRNYEDIFDMILSDPGRQIMDYRVVIENENFIFLLVNQNSQSKLVKICKTVESSQVYEDIPIICNLDGVNLTHVDHGSFLSVSGKTFLVALFSNLRIRKSSVCIFEESEIYEAFLQSRKDRFECPSHDLQAADFLFKYKLSDFNLKNCVNLTGNEVSYQLHSIQCKVLGL